MTAVAGASIVVPVCNEAAILARSVPAVLASARETGAEVLWVCNGSSDGSAQLLHDLVAGACGATVIEVAPRGKTLALQAGDDHFEDLFPRVYFDADTWLRPGDLRQLCSVLREGSADLAGPAHAFDCTGVTRVSAGIAQCWLALPLGGQTSILGVVGVSKAGRDCWGKWPSVLGDDIFVRAMIPAARACRVAETLATSPAPVNFAGWVRRRARWLSGERQLRAMGLNPPGHPDQRRVLLSRLLHGPDRSGAMAFVAARLAAGYIGVPSAESSWKPERRR